MNNPTIEEKDIVLKVTPSEFLPNNELLQQLLTYARLTEGAAPIAVVMSLKVDEVGNICWDGWSWATVSTQTHDEDSNAR